MICDFDCKIFNINRFDICDKANDTIYLQEKIQNDLDVLDKCSIHKLVCYIRHNDDHNVKITLERINSFRCFIDQLVSSETLKKFKIHIYPKLYLSTDSPYIKNISKLAVGDRKRIFLELPLLPQPDFPDEALNKILYNCHLIPVFTDFQNYNIFYSKDLIDKLIRIHNAAFQFSINKINNLDNLDIIKRIIRNGNTVLLGTSADHDNLNEREIIRNLNLLKKNLSIDTYREILIRSNKMI